jgi:hypothetical protein
MQQWGYARTINGDDGKTYQLPTGTYVGAGSPSSASTALQAAVAAANATGKTSSIIVADWSSARWQGAPDCQRGTHRLNPAGRRVPHLNLALFATLGGVNSECAKENPAQAKLGRSTLKVRCNRDGPGHPPAERKRRPQN